jgi:excisionase family DNA binding protein
MVENDLIPPRTAAILLGVHVNTLRAWTQKGIIQELRTPTNHRRFRRTDIQTIIDGMAQQQKGQE